MRLFKLRAATDYFDCRYSPWHPVTRTVAHSRWIERSARDSGIGVASRKISSLCSICFGNPARSAWSTVRNSANFCPIQGT